MKKTLYFIILTLLFGCKTESTPKDNVDLKTSEKSKETSKVNNDIKYVIAKSGLNYRKKPKGKIIGKFEFGEQVEIKKRTQIFQNISDEGKQIKGEWLGVITKNQPDIKYVFDGFLANKKELEKIGSNFMNFIPKDYEIEYKAEGDLNSDQINDIALVVKRKVNFTGKRDVIILLKQHNIYRLDKISKTVFPSKVYSDYSKSYENYYYAENFHISNNELIIELYGQGALPDNISKFKYFDEKLLLTHIKVYAHGAGETYESKYDVISGKVITEITNLLKEDITSKVTTKYVDKKEYEFENSNPRDINF